MPFEIVRNDIANMQVDAIVNTVSTRAVIGYGADAGIHRKAGPKLLEARKKIGRIAIGRAAITPGFDLQAKYVIHAAGPVWQGGGCGETQLLRSCYEESLKLAGRHRCRSVAFPLMCAGNHGFPKEIALQVAMDAIRSFLRRHEMQVILVVFSREAFRVTEKQFPGITGFIDDHYVLEKNLQQYGVADKCSLRGVQQEQILQEQMRLRRESVWEDFCEYAAAPCQTAPEAAPEPKAKSVSGKKRLWSAKREKPSLAQLLAQTDAGFSETLLTLIDRTGKKDSQIYSKANLSRQHFSKIRNNPDYKPTKATAIALALALELDLEQTRDLIGRAGYALTNSSKADVIVMYFIQEKNYDLYEINAVLFEFDQMLLGV